MERFGTRNKLVNAQATMQALELLKPLRGGSQVAAQTPAVGPSEHGDVIEMPKERGSAEVREVTKDEVAKQRDIHRRGTIGE